MQGQKSSGGPGQRLGISMVLLLLGGLFALTLVWQTIGQAGVPPFQPQVTAIFPQDQVQLAVVLPKDTARAGNLQVELVGEAGQVLAGDQKAITPAEEAVAHRFDLKLDKTQAAKAQVRVTFRNQKFETPLARVILAKAHEATLSGGQEFYAGTQASLNCTVQGVLSLSETVPLAGAQITLRLKDKDGKTSELYQGKTGFNGQANIQFDLPEVAAGPYTLEIHTRSALGEEKIERAIRLKSDAKILLVSDKPIYQPGQLMHIRALVLRPVDMKPVAAKDMIFEVEDSKGNKVYKKTLKTSEFGIASVDFQLADEVNMGDYHLRANLVAPAGDASPPIRADKTVTVKRYVLPKFKVEVKADKSFYLPKELVKVELQSDYFFGKPVSNAKVEVTANTFDVAFRPFHKWNGTTDAQGHAKFEIQLPDYFVGQPLQKGNALVKLDVKVLDSAEHTEAVTKTYTVSDQPIRVSLIPESGKVVPGMDNRIFAAAIYPDGSPAAGCEVKFWIRKVQNAPVPPPGRMGRGIAVPVPAPGVAAPVPAQVDQPAKEDLGEPLATAKTNSAGLAEFRITPKTEQFRQASHGQRDIEFLGGKQQVWGPNFVLDVRAEAKDQKGNQAVHIAELNSQPMGENVLLRLDKAIYQTGERMNIEVRTSAGLPTVYIDVVRGGQIMLSRWYEVKDGQASQQIDLPQNLFGSLEVHAYQMLTHGEIIRDSRVVYVQSRNDLKIDIQADKEEYLPGANGRLRFQVTDSRGIPTAAALGVIIVDEAVYALQEMQPGLEKVYFTLQEELLKPQVQIKFSPAEGIDNLIMQPVVPAPRQQIAEVLLTSVKLPLPQRWEINPGLERRQRIQGQVQNIGQALFNYAWNNAENFLAYDKETQKWSFRPGLLEDLVKIGQVHAQGLEGPFGGKLTLEDLVRLEKSFTADALAQAITAQRIQQLTWQVFHYTNQEKHVADSQKKASKYFRNGRWELPETVIEEMTKAQHYDRRMLKDGWGEPLRLVKRDKKIESFTGPQFEYFEIVSAGPDRKLNTGDDVTFAQARQINQIGWLGGLWWLEERERLAQAQMGPGRGFGRQAGMMRRDMRFRDEGGLGGGIELEEAAKAMPMMARPQAAAMNGFKAEAKGEPAPTAAPVPNGGSATGGGGAPAPITKIREYFPETMLWQPALITDDKGLAMLAVNFADSITTWRLSASANSRGGALGGINVPLKVFQDFFVDIDLPVSLTQSDEVAFPVAVYNYLKTPQTVKIQLEKEPWFELMDTAGLERKLDLKPNEVTSVSFRIKAGKIGSQPLTVKAYGSKMSDAVKRVVEVVPNGQKFEKVISDRLAADPKGRPGENKISQVITIPENAIPEASKLMVRIYPGVMAQVLEGVEGLIRLPGG